MRVERFGSDLIGDRPTLAVEEDSVSDIVSVEVDGAVVTVGEPEMWSVALEQRALQQPRLLRQWWVGSEVGAEAWVLGEVELVAGTATKAEARERQENCVEATPKTRT